MMRIRWLLVALSLVLIICIKDVHVRIFVSVFLCVYYFLLYKKAAWILWMIILVFNFRIISEQNSMPNVKTLVIEEIRSTYAIASVGKQKVLVYNLKEDVQLLDIIEVRGQYEIIHSITNDFVFNFQTRMNRKAINFQIYAQSYVRKARSNTLKANLYRHIDMQTNQAAKTHLKKMFYHIEDEPNEFSYLMYASGIHLSFLASLIAKIIRKEINHVRIGVAVLYLCLFPYTFFTIRILISTLCHCLLKKQNRKDILGCSVCMLLFLNPYYLYEIGMIIFLAFSLIDLFDIKKISKNLKSYIVLIPIQLVLFNQCNLVTIFLFKWLRALSSLIFIISCIVVCLPAAYLIVEPIVSVYEGILQLIPHQMEIIGQPKLWWILLWLYLTIALLSNVKKQYVMLFLALLLFQMNMRLFSFYGEVTFIDVGQGDCILIKEPFLGKTILIDVAGKMNSDLSKTTIYPALKAKGIKKLDYVIITHDDYDHAGGLASLKKLIPIERVITDMDELTLSQIKFYNLNHKSYDDENDKSIVLYAQIYGLNYLFMGDASKLIEQDVINVYNRLKIDVLKVGHHGSNTSSSEKFIHTINPRIGIISSGHKNRYGHPHEEVLQVLKRNRSIVYNTQIDGSISIYFSRYLNFVKTGRKQFGIIDLVKK